MRWDEIRVGVDTGWDGMAYGMGNVVEWNVIEDSVRSGVVWEVGWDWLVDGMRWGMTGM